MKQLILIITLLFTLNVWAQQSKFNDNLVQYDSDVLANPQNGDLYFERATLKQNYLDFKGAVEDYKTAIKKKSAYAARANYAMGMLAMNYSSYPTVGKPVIATGYGSASSYFTNAIKLKPDYGEAYFQAAKCKFYLNKFQQAIEYFSKSIELKSELTAEAYYYRGLCKSNSKDKNGACTDFSKAVSLGNVYGVDMLERFCK